MNNRNLALAICAAHAGVLAVAAVIGGCAKERCEMPSSTVLTGEAIQTLGEKRVRAHERKERIQPEIQEIDRGKSARTATRETVGRVGAERAGDSPADENGEVVNAVAPRTHRVESGDSLWKISRRYGVSLDDLAEANNIGRGEILRVGQELVIPGPGGVIEPHEEVIRAVETGLEELPGEPGGETGVVKPSLQHVVKKGETLWGIAKEYGTTSREIIEVNGIKNPSLIRPGDVLAIPGN